jgi:hypothetical protein
MSKDSQLGATTRIGNGPEQVEADAIANLRRGVDLVGSAHDDVLAIDYEPADSTSIRRAIRVTASTG